MRKALSIFAILLSVLSCIHAQAQAFSLDQLKGFNILSMPEFKKEMKNLNYRFYDKTEGLGFVLTEYDAPDYQSKIGKFEYKDQSDDRIEYEFKGKKEYDQYLKIVQDAGYKAIEKGKTIAKEPYTDYYKNKEHIRFVLPKTGQTAPYTILIFK